MLNLLRSGLMSVALAGAAIAGAPSAHADTFRLTVATGQAPVFPYIGLIQDFVVPEITRRVSEETEHDIVWTEAYAGTLVKVGGELEGISVGLADMGVVLFTAHLSQLPLHTISYFLPFATTDVRQTVAAFTHLQETIPAIGGAWEKHNQVFLASIPVEAFNLYSKRPVNSVADLNGLKVGAIGPNAHWFRDLGAVGVTFNLANIYNDMQTGVFDAAVLADSVAASINLHEVAPYRTQIDYGPEVFAGVTINKQRWDALPENVQAIFRDVFAQYQERTIELLINRKKDGDARMIAEGLKIVELDQATRLAWVNAMPNIAADWAKELDAKGLPASEAVKAFLTSLRDSGSTPLRDWDKF